MNEVKDRYAESIGKYRLALVAALEIANDPFKAKLDYFFVEKEIVVDR